MKVLITGGNGQLAYDLLRANHRAEIIAPSKSELDITDIDAVHAAIKKFGANAVINAAAYTQVDKAEQEIAQAFAVNGDGAKNLAVICEDLQIPLLHVSTDYVFNGEQMQSYRETDFVSPMNVYGASKLHGERAIQESCERHIILRVSSVFGVQGTNFVKTILRLAREREQLRIVADQLMCPTPAAAIAETLWDLVWRNEKISWGIYHYCGGQPLSWFEFAKKIINVGQSFETLRVNTIEPIPATDYPTPAKRPRYSVLNCEKLSKTFNIQQPDWEVGLTHVISALYSK